MKNKKLISYLNWFYFQLNNNNDSIYELKIKIIIILLKSNEINIDLNEVYYNFNYNSNKKIFDYLRKNTKPINKLNLYYERLYDIKFRLLEDEEMIKIKILNIILDYLGNSNDYIYEIFFEKHLQEYFKDVKDFINKIYDYDLNFDFDKIYKFIIFNPIFIRKKENKYIKKSIPKSLRIKVWNTYIGEDIGKTKCLCCKTIDITQSIFECGHLLAEAKGGETSLSYLRPICSTCNKSMKTINMDDYMIIINR